MSNIKISVFANTDKSTKENDVLSFYMRSLSVAFTEAYISLEN